MIRVYLDTNLFRQFFEKLYDEVKVALPFKEPAVFKFFRENKDKIQYFTSSLSKAEIFRQLKSDFDLREKEMEDFWKRFRTLLSVNEIKEFRITEKIVDIVKKQSFRKKTLVNILHLFIAKRTALIFVTGDKEIVDKARNVYKKVYSYPEFREKFEKGSF